MDDKADKIDFSIRNLDFLEQIDDGSVLEATESAFARSTKTVDYISLEATDNTEFYQNQLPETVKGALTEAPSHEIIIRSETGGVQALKTYWSRVPANMGEVVTKVFEFSDRPFIIIRDDKIAYMNKTAMTVLELTGKEEIIGSSFWSYVDEQDWKMLSENIGAMLTEDRMTEVRLKTEKNRVYKIKLQAIYLDDEQHFTFVLVGNHKIKYNPSAGLYDAVTGLPNFYLFEDRVQIAVNNEKYKDVRQRKNKMAVLGVAIDNLEDLRKVNMVDFVLKKLASKLVFRLKKSYTISRGLKYQFWFLINDFNNRHDLEVEFEKIRAIFDEPVTGNYMDYNIMTTFGYSIYPDDASTANKLIELAIEEISEKLRNKQN